RCGRFPETGAARRMKIAIFCPNWVGDMVMATPALRAVRRQYPRAEIVAILRPYVADVLSGLELVDRIICHAPAGGAAGLSGWRLAGALRRERFDWALVLPNSFRSAWWARVTGARRRVGFARNGRGWLLTDTIRPRSRRDPNPVLDEYLRLARRFGCRELSRRTELATTTADERHIRQFWARQRLGAFGTRGVVCLNPGGAFGAAKHWPTESFAELAGRIAADLEKRVLVLCGPSEREQAREIVAGARHPAVVSLADEAPSIGLTKAAIKHSDLLVTTDSGPRHFAQPFGVPVVTLFGPTHTAWSETYYNRGLHLQLDLECGPCQQRVCPLAHHRCMRDLSVDWVFRAATTLLQKYPARSEVA
ncbi:MAG TPA: lipopolysaccharide heptosyltransferase II, partial [Planctomycetaceae bacterium]|nr:lipopolysaccharide heptosyltransferase II [Planctomycetaceae bacterium]